MFEVSLSLFRGPIDLLLYLVRKNELDIQNIPIAVVLEQYLEYLDVLKMIDINEVGEFIALASTLVEIKSFEVLPGETEIEEESEDPRKELVQQLLEYKKYCEAATELQQRSERWQLRFPRLANDLPTRSRNVADEPIREVELWDLVSAFGRIMRENAPAIEQNIIYDDTPITTHIKRIYQRLKVENRVAFRQLFTPMQHKSTMIGIFLAVLELVRHEFATVVQETLFGEIELLYCESSKPLDFAAIA